MLSIQKMTITDETDAFIEVSTESDYQYSIMMHAQIRVITEQGNSLKGKLSYVGQEHLKIQTVDIGEITIKYSSIVEMIEDGFRIY